MHISFKDVFWFEANLCAVLGAAIYQTKRDRIVVELTNCSNKFISLFGRNNFARLFGKATYDLQDDTTIRFTMHQPNDTQEISDYIKTRLVKEGKFPALSKGLRSKIAQSFFEVYENAIHHSDCTEIFSCGQFYPNKTPPRIDFTVVDLGKTIETNVSNYLKQNIKGWEAIEWALQDDNTTKVGDIPGGLGLKVIQEFVKLNNGKIQIVSGTGYWELRKGIKFSKPMGNSFPGTLVNFEINLDEKYYYDDEEDFDTLEF